MRRLLKFSIVLFILAGVLFLVTKIYRTRSRDSAGPEITVENESISVSIHDPESVLLAGVTAFDKKDGDVTQSIVIERISNFLEKDTRIVTYAAFDRDNHVTRASREITYTDYDPPEFAAAKPFSFRLGDTDVLAGVSASDCLDGSLSDRIRLLSDDAIDEKTPGEYQAYLQASNSAGDVITLPVILEYGAPESTPKVLLKNYIQYLDPGEAFDPASLLAGVQIGSMTYEIVNGRGNYGSEDRQRGEAVYVGRNDIVIDGTVDSNVPGNYIVTYSYTVENEAAGPVTGKTRLYVVVREKAGTAS